MLCGCSASPAEENRVVLESQDAGSEPKGLFWAFCSSLKNNHHWDRLSGNKIDTNLEDI